MIPPYDMSDAPRDFHAVVTVTLGELITDKWVDWTDPSWHWDSYNDEQYTRVCEKFNNHFWDREIGVLPPGSWKREVLRKFNEIMPKYKLVYQALENGVDILQDSDTYGKNRNVFSDFPATQIAPQNQDYASNATDNQFETIVQGNFLEKMEKIKDYNDIDLMIINDMDSLFSCFYSVSLNIY
jgi:hypothetical protein